ncbi:MAG: NBR1-Ig-like domain-containing protein [Anaerolineaceae bacterium]
MRTTTFSYKLLGGILFLAILAGCAQATPTPTTVPPTVDIQSTMNAVKTQAVNTAMAKLTMDAPTATTAPTKTKVPAATKTSAPTRTLAPWWTATAVLPSGGCSITSFSPEMNAVFAPNDSFDGKWEIMNKSDGAWLQNEVDIRYVSGTKFQTNVDTVDLAGDIGEEENTTVVVDMQAPATVGTYVTNWAIYRGNDLLCGLSLTIKVQ